MSSMVLATAIELARLHGARYAAFYLLESGIDVEVAIELLGRQVPMGSKGLPLLFASNSGSTVHDLDAAQLKKLRRT